VNGTFVIIEGADGSGKTTLAERIAEEYGAEYEHVGPPREDMTPFAEHIGYAFELAPDYGQVVFDRFHLGCFCYGPIFRPERDVDGIGDFRREDWDLLERLIRPHCLLVLCDPGWDILAANVAARNGAGPFPEYERDPKKLREVHRRFKLATEFSTLSSVTYDYTEDVDGWLELTERIGEVLGWVRTSIPTI
jgi:hypothetical protein